LARGAVSAIKQGCELYNQFKGEVVEAQKTIGEAKKIVREVGGFFGFFKRKVEVHVADEQATEKRGKKVTFDEAEVRKDISDNLVKFFKALEQLKAHIAEEEAKSQNVYDPDQNMMESALHRVLAMDEMDKLQYEIRQVMVYQTPGMGDLYTRVIRMVGVISEEQEFARMQKIKRERDAAWQRKRVKEMLVDRLLIVATAVLVAVYLVGMWYLIVKDRGIRWGF
jgi:hypothetical protein